MKFCVLVIFGCLGLSAGQDDSRCTDRGGQCGDVRCCPDNDYVSDRCSGGADRKCCFSDLNCSWRTLRFISVISALRDVLQDETRSSVLSHSQAMAKIKACGVGIKSSSGITDGRKCSTCTSLQGIRSNAIDNACILKRASGCTVTVSGGTEDGHSGGTKSHGTGYKLDFSRNSCLDGYIKRSFTFSGYRGSDAIYKARSGNLYYLEGNHWDVLYP